MGSPSDMEHCKKIEKTALQLGLQVEIRVSSAHKETEETLRIVAEYEGNPLYRDKVHKILNIFIKKIKK